MLMAKPDRSVVCSAGRFPVFVAEGLGAHFRCVDGKDYLDLCLGDTGAMTGHASAPVVKVTSVSEREQFLTGEDYPKPSPDVTLAP